MTESLEGNWFCNGSKVRSLRHWSRVRKLKIAGNKVIGYLSALDPGDLDGDGHHTVV
ncbi:MAG: hypothetical protein LBQ00_04775 [Syntrophobacterales bacterium]|nr:hypothetical protein [Syntrophobacterales bacterium]